MRAAVLAAFSQDWQFQTLPDPHPAPGQVVIRIRASGMCGTDLHARHGHLGAKLPIVLGHEGRSEHCPTAQSWMHVGGAIKAHLGVIAGMDFFMVEVVTAMGLVQYHVLFVIDIGSIKSECLDRIVPLGEKHLRWAIGEYLAHYHGERNHQGLYNVLLKGAPSPANENGRVQRRERLGGLLNCYHAMRPDRGSILFWDTTGSRVGIEAMAHTRPAAPAPTFLPVAFVAGRVRQEHTKDQTLRTSNSTPAAEKRVRARSRDS